MLNWLLSLGFSEDQIEQYAKSKNHSLKELIQDNNAKIDSIISRQLLLDLYKLNH